MKPLTKRQREVLDYIKGFIASHKYPPTFREISEHFSISVKGAYDHVKALERKQTIQLNNHRSRTIEVIEPENDHDNNNAVVAVPILGNVAAGRPVFADENYEGSVSLPQHLVKNGRYFALHVRGDSMQDAGIHDGDIAVISQQNTARTGDIVVAMIDDAVTLKRFYREKNRVRLKAENPQYPPIFTQDVRIIGKLAHIIRSYE
jgi:repressor LexA